MNARPSAQHLKGDDRRRAKSDLTTSLTSTATTHHGPVVLKRTYATKTKLLYEDGHVEEVWHTDRLARTAAVPSQPTSARPRVQETPVTSMASPLSSSSPAFLVPSSARIREASLVGLGLSVPNLLRSFSPPKHPSPAHTRGTTTAAKRFPVVHSAHNSQDAPVQAAELSDQVDSGTRARGGLPLLINVSQSASPPEKTVVGALVSPAASSAFRMAAVRLPSPSSDGHPLRQRQSTVRVRPLETHAMVPQRAELTHSRSGDAGAVVSKTGEPAHATYLTEVEDPSLASPSVAEAGHQPLARLASWRITLADGTVTNAAAAAAAAAGTNTTNTLAPPTPSSTTADSISLTKRLAEVRAEREAKRVTAHRVVKPHAPSMLSIALPYITEEGELRTTSQPPEQDQQEQPHDSVDADLPLTTYPNGTTPVALYERIVEREQGAMQTRLSGIDVSRFMRTSPEASTVALLYFWYVVLRCRRSFLEHLLEGRYKLLLNAYQELFPRRQNLRLPEPDHLERMVDELLLSGEQWKMEADADAHMLPFASATSATSAVNGGGSDAVTSVSAAHGRRRLDAFYRENGYTALLEQPELHRTGVPVPLDVVWRLVAALDAFNSSRSEFTEVQLLEERCFHGLALHFGRLFLALKQQKDFILESYEHVVSHITYYALLFHFINDAHGHIFNDDFRVDLFRLFHYWCSGLLVTHVPTHHWPVPLPSDVAAAFEAEQQVLAAREAALWCTLGDQRDPSDARPPPALSGPTRRQQARQGQTRWDGEKPLLLAPGLPTGGVAEDFLAACVVNQNGVEASSSSVADGWSGALHSPIAFNSSPQTRHSPSRRGRRSTSHLTENQHQEGLLRSPTDEAPAPAGGGDSSEYDSTHNDEDRTDDENNNEVQEAVGEDNALPRASQNGSDGGRLSDPLAGMAALTPKRSRAARRAVHHSQTSRHQVRRGDEESCSGASDTVSTEVSEAGLMTIVTSQDDDSTLTSHMAPHKVRARAAGQQHITESPVSIGRVASFRSITTTTANATAGTTAGLRAGGAGRGHRSASIAGLHEPLHDPRHATQQPRRRKKKVDRKILPLQPLPGEEDFDTLDVEVANGEYRLISKFERYAQHANQLVDQLEKRVQRQHQRQARKNVLLEKTVEQTRQHKHTQREPSEPMTWPARSGAATTTTTMHSLQRAVHGEETEKEGDGVMMEAGSPPSRWGFSVPEQLLRPASAASTTSTRLSFSVASSIGGSTVLNTNPPRRTRPSAKRVGVQAGGKAASSRTQAKKNAKKRTGTALNSQTSSSSSRPLQKAHSTTSTTTTLNRAAAVPSSSVATTMATTTREEVAQSRFQISGTSVDSHATQAPRQAAAAAAAAEARHTVDVPHARHDRVAKAAVSEPTLQKIAAVTSASLGDPTATSLLTAFPLAVCGVDTRAFLIDRAGIRYTRVPFPLTTSSASAAAVLEEQLREFEEAHTSHRQRLRGVGAGGGVVNTKLQRHTSFSKQSFTSNGAAMRRNLSFRSGALLGSVYHPVSTATALLDAAHVHSSGEDDSGEDDTHGARPGTAARPGSCRLNDSHTSLRKGHDGGRVSAASTVGPWMLSTVSLGNSIQTTTTSIAPTATPSGTRRARGRDVVGAEAILAVHTLPRTFVYYMEQKQQQKRQDQRGAVAAAGSLSVGTSSTSGGGADAYVPAASITPAHAPKASLPAASPFMLYYADRVLKMDISGDASGPAQSAVGVTRKATLAKADPRAATTTPSSGAVVVVPTSDGGRAPLPQHALTRVPGSPGGERGAVDAANPMTGGEAWSPIKPVNARTGVSECISWLPTLGGNTNGDRAEPVQRGGSPRAAKKPSTVQPNKNSSNNSKRAVTGTGTLHTPSASASVAVLSRDEHEVRRSAMENAAQRRRHVAPRAPVRLSTISREEGRARPLLYQQLQHHVSEHQEQVQLDMEVLDRQERVSRHAYQSEHLRTVQAVREILSDNATRRYQRRAREALELREREKKKADEAQ